MVGDVVGSRREELDKLGIGDLFCGLGEPEECCEVGYACEVVCEVLAGRLRRFRGTKM
jgi:hypothetical protein